MTSSPEGRAENDTRASTESARENSRSPTIVLSTSLEGWWELVKRRKRRRRGFDYRIYDPKDGIDIHRIVTGGSGKASRKKIRISQFEYDNVFIEMNGDRWAKEVSIMRRVRKINKYKGMIVNPDKDKINRKA